jgi:hypothetical protein
VTYVSSSYKYCIAYKLILEERDERQRARESAKTAK